MKQADALRLGVHVSIEGGLLKALERAAALGCSTMQIFSRSPRGGAAPTLSAETLRQFAAARLQADIDPLIVHAPYIMNLASPDAWTWKRSVVLATEEVQRCAAIGARYLVMHVGSHRGSGEAAGIARVAEALNQALAGASDEVMILLENTAGSGQGLGDTFEQLAAMRHGVTRRQAVGFCLDTAHLFAAGFPIHTAEGLAQTLQQAERLLGFEHVRAVHLNDSKVALNSRVDRHWHIGEGHIGLAAMQRLVTDPRVNRLPMILETPKKTPADDPRNLAMVRGFVTARTTRSRSPAHA
jgi:deoxyribonuclease-4